MTTEEEKKDCENIVPQSEYTREKRKKRKKEEKKFIKYFWMTEQEDDKTEKEIRESIKRKKVTYTYEERDFQN